MGYFPPKLPRADPDHLLLAAKRSRVHAQYLQCREQEVKGVGERTGFFPRIDRIFSTATSKQYLEV